MKKDTALGRSLRVLGYQLLTVLVGTLIDPGFVKNVTDAYPQLSVLFFLGAPLLSAVYNVLRSDVQNF